MLSRAEDAFGSEQTRASVLTAAQCATYDEVKKAWKRMTGWEDAFPTHLASSLATGLVTTTITAPVDVVKTHMFMGELPVGYPLSLPIELVLCSSTCVQPCQWQRLEA